MARTPDTERRWGFMDDGVFVPVPKVPITLAGLKPPVACTMADGSIRYIIEEPLPEPPPLAA